MKRTIMYLVVFMSFNISAQTSLKNVVIKGMPFSANPYLSLEQEDIDKMQEDKTKRYYYYDSISDINKINNLQKYLRKIVKKGVKAKGDYDLRLGIYFVKNSKVYEKYYIDRNKRVIFNDYIYKVANKDYVELFFNICKPKYSDSLANEKKYWIYSSPCKKN